MSLEDPALPLDEPAITVPLEEPGAHLVILWLSSSAINILPLESTNTPFGEYVLFKSLPVPFPPAITEEPFELKDVD